jgi:gluconate 5-dehydrogenase
MNGETDNNPTVLQQFSLQGRVAMITGASGHLGSAMASALAEAGARVVTTGRDEERAASIAAALPNSRDLQHFGVKLDHTNSDSIDQCIAKVLKVAGRIDVLVNNGHEPIAHDWKTVTAYEFDRHMKNLSGYFLLARHVRNHAVERGAAASVIMLGSMYGLVGSYPDAYQDICSASPAAYHALKGGVVHLTRHLAVYWAKDNVRVNCLSPGAFPAGGVDPQLVERLSAKAPLGRIGGPHELTGALLLLASDAGSYITGHNLIVDGGWTAW